MKQIDEQIAVENTKIDYIDLLEKDVNLLKNKVQALK